MVLKYSELKQVCWRGPLFEQIYARGVVNSRQRESVGFFPPKKPEKGRKERKKLELTKTGFSKESPRLSRWRRWRRILNLRCGRSARLAHGICAMHDWTSLCIGQVWRWFFNIFFSVIVRCEVEITVTCKWKMIVYGSEIFFGWGGRKVKRVIGDLSLIATAWWRQLGRCSTSTE